MKSSKLSLAAVFVAAAAPAAMAREHMNEIKIMEGHKKRSHVVSPLPHT
jgi:hypothetical protein